MKKKLVCNIEYIGDIYVGDKIPSSKVGYIKVLAFEDGHVMARYKGMMVWCVPLHGFKQRVKENLSI